MDISESGIAWDTDKNNVYKAPKSAESIQWADTTNGDLMFDDAYLTCIYRAFYGLDESSVSR